MLRDNRIYGLKKDGVTRASTQVEIEQLTLKSVLNAQISLEMKYIIEIK
jgi:hypothetical protein